MYRSCTSSFSFLYFSSIFFTTAVSGFPAATIAARTGSHPSGRESTEINRCVSVRIFNWLTSHCLADAARLRASGVLKANEPSAEAIPTMVMEFSVASVSFRTGERVCTISSSSFLLLPTERSISALLMPNCKLAIPFPSMIFGRITNSGSIHDSCNASFTSSIKVTGLLMAAMSIVSIPVHSPQPSVETTATNRPSSVPSGNCTVSL